MADTPDTIVLIHGFWVTPRSWEHWIERYEQAGYRVIAPAYPGFEVEVEALNADTSPVAALTVPAVIEHLEAVIDELEAPPILMGHSAGGAFVQFLLDHGYGAAGVAINSAPTEGVRVTPPSQSSRRSRSSRTPPIATAPSPSRTSSGTTCSRTPSRSESRALLRALSRPGVGRDSVGQRAGEPGPGPQDVGRLQ